MILLLPLFTQVAFSLEENSRHKQGGAGLSYVFPFGNFKSYFQENLAYALEARVSMKDKTNLYWASSFQYNPMVSDDVRQSSRAHLFTTNFGAEWVPYRSSWYTLFLGLRPEITYWFVRNNMSDSYDKSDNGYFGALMLGLNNSFHIRSFHIELFLNGHFPKIYVKTNYFELGLRIAKDI